MYTFGVFFHEEKRLIFLFNQFNDTRKQDVSRSNDTMNRSSLVYEQIPETRSCDT